MKITFEKLDQGYLVTAEANGQVERLAFMEPESAFAAVSDALGIVHPEPARPPLTNPARYHAAAAPAPELPEQVQTAPVDEPPPASGRRGLLQPRKSPPPAGRSATR